MRTRRAPWADGEGALEICIGEAPGRVQLRDLELRPGCADVMWRLFEHGAVLLNGSVRSPVEFPLGTLAPG
jgi:hypothetical protein